MHFPRPLKLRWPLAAAGGLAVLFLAAHAVLNSDAMAARVRSHAREALARHAVAEFGPKYSVSWLGEVRLGPLQLAAAEGKPPLATIEEVRVRPAFLPLLEAKLEPARVTLVGLTVHLDPGAEGVRAWLHELGARGGASGSRGSGRRIPVVVLDDARLQIERAGASPLEVGPLDGRFSTARSNGVRTVDAQLSVDRGRAALHGRFDTSGAQFRATADALPIARLVPRGDGLPVSVGAGLLAGTIEFQAPAHAQATAKIDAKLSGLVIAGAAIADEPVGPMEAAYRGTLDIDLAHRSLRTAESALLLGPAGLEIPFDGSLELAGEPRFDLDVRLGPVNVQELAGALPPQLAPVNAESRERAGEGHAAGRVLLEPPHADGPVRAEIRASGPLRRPDDWSVGVRLDTQGLQAAARQAPFALRAPFVYKPRDAAGVERTIVVGPRNPSFVPLEELPPIVAAAVVTSEDGNFFEHDGFDFDEIRDSIATAAEGHRLRGGSTITQQLVKNLYLSRERTLARKVREALITLQLEAALPKPRILEIYLNVIEWGPGVYGIGEAARHYFGIDARQLSAKQAVFLATLIPNPVKYSVYFRKGATSPNWNAHMAHLIEKLHQRGDLDDAQFASALAAPVAFRRQVDPASPTQR